MSNLKQVKLLTQMWNTLDVSPIENHLSNEIEYSSAWVVLSIKGKYDFLDFMTKKLKTIHTGKENGLITFLATVIKIKGIKNQYFVELTYELKDENKEILIRVEVKSNLITSIHLFPKSTELVTIKFK